MAFTASDWGQGRLLTGLSPGSSLTGFTAVITKDNLEVAALDAGALSCLNGGGDWRFSTDIDGVNQLPCEIVTCVTSATPANTEFVAWVRFPTYASGTREVYAFWNKAGESQPAVGAAFGRNAVWVDFEYVSHDGVTDSTGNYGISRAGSPTVGTDPWGGNSVSLDGSTQYGRTTVSIGLTAGFPLYFSAWAKPDAPLSGSALGVFNSASSNFLTTVYLNSGDLNVLDRFQSNFGETIATATAAPTAGTWQRYEGDFTTASSRTVYLDGGNSATNTVTDTATRTMNRLTYGRFDDSSPGNYFSGELAHLTLSLTARNSDFAASGYDNQNDPAAFWTEGAVFVPGGGGAISVTESLTTLTLDSLNPTIGLTGVVSITESLTNINFAALDPVITLTATITVTESLTNLNFNTFAPTVTLTPPDTILVTETTTALTLDTFNPTITFSGTITVTESLTNLDFRTYRPAIQVGAKDYSNIFYGVAPQQVTFTGTSVSSTFSGTIKQAPDFSGIIKTSTFSGVSK